MKTIAVLLLAGGLIALCLAEPKLRRTHNIYTITTVVGVRG